MHSPGPFYRSGFTRGDVIATIAIIVVIAGTVCLLIPSIGGGRDYRRISTFAQLDTLSKGLETFENEFRYYPDSRTRVDPIADFPGGTGENQLSGAHWLARALAGPDLNGIDKDTRSLGAETNPPLKMADIEKAERCWAYVDVKQKQLVPDNDRTLKHGGDFAPTGRPVVLDPYGRPILYYRAYPRGRQPFSRRGTIQPAGNDEPLGIYNQEDNARFTGSDQYAGWDFAGKSKDKPVHPLGVFGSNDPAHVDDRSGLDGHYSFSGFLHDRGRPVQGQIRVVNADYYVLISAGKDGLYGTADDVANFTLPNQ